ncbi:hypothetical protein G6011_00999 [Alternaria panax]|uniref:Uncharacterized protein n=1 Tax=Alternaria panax TaxID=48097 RepID=A0AAD4NVG3_9PLEO|nr:hypothetical protein G6011_00999 [Alternaria panax]
MYRRPINHAIANEDDVAAAVATSSSSPSNPPDNGATPTSWFSDEEDVDTSAISNTDLDANDTSVLSLASSLASSPPPLLSTPNSSNKKTEAPSGLLPDKPLSSPTHNPPIHTFTTINAFPSPAATPTPPPRAARSSELLNARIASYEARTAEAAAIATARATARASTGVSVKSTPAVNAKPEPPSLSPLSPPGNRYDTVSQHLTAPPPTRVKKADNTQKLRIVTAQEPTDPPSLAKQKTRTLFSVTSQLSPFADFYAAATDQFPRSTAEDAGCLEPEYRDHVGDEAPGPSRRRGGMMVSELEEGLLKRWENESAVEDGDEDEEEEEDWEKDDENKDEESALPSFPQLSRFQIGGEEDMTAFTGGASSSRQGNVGGKTNSRSSHVSSSPSVSELSVSDAQREEANRSFWTDVQTEVREAADSVLAAGKKSPRYPRTNSDFSHSALPARNEHSEPVEPTGFSTRKPDREDVYQVFLSGYPNHQVSDVFYDSIDQTQRMNEEAKRRAICIDDPDAEFTLPPCVACETIKLPLHERLSMLPSPSNFTPLLAPKLFTFGTYNYRPRDHSLQAIEMASTAPDLELKDESLKARAVQFNKNREVIENALKEGGILRGEPDVVHARECQTCHRATTSKSTCNGHQSSADVRLMQSLILEQHELRQDLERLEALERGIHTSFSTLGSLPVRHRYGNAEQRQRLADRTEQGRQERRRQAEVDHAEMERRERETAADVESSDAAIQNSFLLEQELDQALEAVEAAVKRLPVAASVSVATANQALEAVDRLMAHLPIAASMMYPTANLATGEHFPFVDQAGPARPATRRSSSVYSDRLGRSKSRATTPHAVLEVPEITDGENVPHPPQRGAPDRAAAHQIMKGVQTYRETGRTSRELEGSGPVVGESARVGRTKERVRREDAVVTSPSRQEEERYPKRQNIVQL